MNEALVAAFVAMALALVEGCKYLLGRLRERDQEKKKLIEDKKKGRGKRSDTDKPCSRLLELVEAMRNESADLHKWHAVEDPAQPGVKLWWNTEKQQALQLEIDEKLDTLMKMLSSMREVHKTCNEGQIEFIQKMRNENEELRKRIDQLHELRVSDRDTLYERVIAVTESFSRRIEEGMASSSDTGRVRAPTPHEGTERPPLGEKRGGV